MTQKPLGSIGSNLSQGSATIHSIAVLKFSDRLSGIALEFVMGGEDTSYPWR